MTDSTGPFSQTQILNVPCFKKVGSVRRLGDILRQIWGSPFQCWPSDLGKVVGSKTIIFSFVTSF